MRILLALALLMTPFALAAQGDSGRTITKTEIRTEDPQRTHSRLRDVVWDMFEREDMRRETPPENPLDRLWLQTRSRGTEIPGLCRYDRVTVEFAPARRNARGPDVPVRAVGLRAVSQFGFMVPPRVLYHEAADHERLPSEGDCHSASIRELSFFTAPNEQIALDGYLAFLSLQNSLRDERETPLDCDLARIDRMDCRGLILSFDPAAIYEIDRCDSDTSGELCFRIWVDSRRVDIVVSGRIYPGPPAGQAIRARLVSLIILSHPRRD